MAWQLQTPVVLIIFNRPDTTEKVFQTIAEAKPSTLFVIADGPRPDRPGDVDKCLAARAIIDRIGWECQVLTNYSNRNLSCQVRVSSGLDWVFSRVEKAIILEDDCVPHPTFFRFCHELLEKYQDDYRMMMVSGHNFQFGQQRTRYSYYFSRYTHVGGWATWRRAWQHYDDAMALWPIIRDHGGLVDILRDATTVNYWQRIFQAVFEGKINAWSYRWTLACWVQSGLTILPNVNLVSNIGYGREATHTVKKNKFADLPTETMSFPLTHPPVVIRHTQADQFTQDHNFKSSHPLVYSLRVYASQLLDRVWPSRRNHAEEPSQPDGQCRL